MIRIGFFILAVLWFSSGIVAQGDNRKFPASVPVKEVPQPDSKITGVEGRTYRNADLGFAITFPDSWLIPGNDFEDHMRLQGFDLSLKAPETLGKASRIQVDRALERVKVLVTAYRAMPGSKDNAILRVAAEDLSEVPEVTDAVDYFDLMRSQFAVMKLPPDFKFSETQAEQLGKRQYGFLDTSSDAGKKRMYATVRGRTALIFTLSYLTDEDLKTFRQILSAIEYSAK